MGGSAEASVLPIVTLLTFQVSAHARWPLVAEILGILGHSPAVSGNSLEGFFKRVLRGLEKACLVTKDANSSAQLQATSCPSLVHRPTSSAGPLSSAGSSSTAASRTTMPPLPTTISAQSSASTPSISQGKSAALQPNLLRFPQYSSPQSSSTPTTYQVRPVRSHPISTSWKARLSLQADKQVPSAASTSFPNRRSDQSDTTPLGRVSLQNEQLARPTASTSSFRTKSARPVQPTPARDTAPWFAAYTAHFFAKSDHYGKSGALSLAPVLAGSRRGASDTPVRQPVSRFYELPSSVRKLTSGETEKSPTCGGLHNSTFAMSSAGGESAKDVTQDVLRMVTAERSTSTPYGISLSRMDPPAESNGSDSLPLAPKERGRPFRIEHFDEKRVPIPLQQPYDKNSTPINRSMERAERKAIDLPLTGAQGEVTKSRTNIFVLAASLINATGLVSAATGLPEGVSETAADKSIRPSPWSSGERVTPNTFRSNTPAADALKVSQTYPETAPAIVWAVPPSSSPEMVHPSTAQMSEAHPPHTDAATPISVVAMKRCTIGQSYDSSGSVTHVTMDMSIQSTQPARPRTLVQQEPAADFQMLRRSEGPHHLEQGASKPVTTLPRPALRTRSPSIVILSEKSCLPPLGQAKGESRARSPTTTCSSTTRQRLVPVPELPSSQKGQKVQQAQTVRTWHFRPSVNRAKVVIEVSQQSRARLIQRGYYGTSGLQGIR